MNHRSLLGFTGDVFLGSTPPGDALQGIGAELTDTTLFVNFEGTLYRPSDALRPQRAKVSLESPAASVSALSHLPVGLVCIGNNHIADFGNDIADFTRKTIVDRYPVFGAGRAPEDFHTAVHPVNDCRVGFASYCMPDSSPLFCTDDRIGPRPFSRERALSDLSRMRSKADHNVAVLHWGDEDHHYPRGDQVETAHWLIRAGFRVVIGNHSHTAQGYERCGEGWIFYSLGNLFFPDHRTRIGNDTHQVQWMPRRSWGLLPRFRVSRERLELHHVMTTFHRRNDAPTRSRRVAHRLRLATYSAALHAPACGAVLRMLRRAEYVAIRLEEFGNNPHKSRALVRQLRRPFGARAAAAQA